MNSVSLAVTFSVIAISLGTQDIPIEVLNTWQPAYASDVQDLCFIEYSQTLGFRSQIDGVIYLADTDSCTYQGEISVPPGCQGFGVAWTEYNGGLYYIDSPLDGTIMYSDDGDSWASFPSPAGSSGMGMDFLPYFTDDLYQISNSPCMLYSVDPLGASWDSYAVPNITGEASGLMAYEIAGDFGDPPGALMVTSRFDHEFHFYTAYASGSIVQYGQEDCPVPVLESLGLTWDFADWTVYWSYLGTDSLYYISELWIPIFGDVGDGNGALEQVKHLSACENPSNGSMVITVNLPEPGPAALRLYDLSGRMAAVLHQGELIGGSGSFSFTGAPGVYTAVLEHSGKAETLRVVLTR